MIVTLAVGHYRSINELRVPLGQLNLITGANGSGKSNLYRALRHLSNKAALRTNTASPALPALLECYQIHSN